MGGVNFSREALNRRVAEFVARFREIGDSHMRDLPLYNPQLEVEAVGFQPFCGDAVGVLITPWFMNALLVPLERSTMDYAWVGRRVTVDLPAGPREFLVGGDEAVGMYRQFSLHSPMAGFAFQEAARVEAQTRLAELLKPAEDEKEASQSVAESARTMDRRSFLGGARAT